DRAQPLAEIVGGPVEALSMGGLPPEALAKGGVLLLIEAAIKPRELLDALARQGVPVAVAAIRLPVRAIAGTGLRLTLRKRGVRWRVADRGQIPRRLRLIADELVACGFVSNVCHVMSFFALGTQC